MIKTLGRYVVSESNYARCVLGKNRRFPYFFNLAGFYLTKTVKSK